MNEGRAVGLSSDSQHAVYHDGEYTKKEKTAWLAQMTKKEQKQWKLDEKLFKAGKFEVENEEPNTQESETDELLELSHEAMAAAEEEAVSMRAESMHAEHSNLVFHFGKFKGSSVARVAIEYKGYLEWFMRPKQVPSPSSPPPPRASRALSRPLLRPSHRLPPRVRRGTCRLRTRPSPRPSCSWASGSAR